LRLVRLSLLIVAILAITHSANAESASNLYLLNCWGCHGSRGEGIKGTAPSLIGLGDFLKVPGGRAYIVEVPGVAMSSLNDAQIALVMNWALANLSKSALPNDFSPYTADEVHRYRGVRLADLSKTRRALMDQLVAMKVRSPGE
jgi:mono/diheme cytochrome c family protein